MGIARAVAARATRTLTPWLGSAFALAPADGAVTLTFDDGPTPGETDRLLGVLQEYGATATFFVLVNRARRNPSLLREVRDAGHEIALHGPDHRRLAQFGTRTVVRRTRDARRELEDLAELPVRWFRPPYGRHRAGDVAGLRSLGLAPVLWESALYDWEDLPQDERLRRGLDETRPGSIVLMHDGWAGPDDGVDDGPDPGVDRVDLLTRTLTALGERDLEPMSLAEGLSDRKLVLRTSWRR
jgi:peptidoglycan/xylan/chitin deacetylase (PgdA/CDA1 family)